MFIDTEDELTLLGACLMQAQKLEFALYGIVSHLSHLPEAKKDSRFRNLTPEKFLRGDPSELKATLGQITKLFGEKLSLACPELDKLIDDRNLIAHNYWRFSRQKNKEEFINPAVFLLDFLENCMKWIKIVRGLLAILTQAAAENEGRTNEANIDKDYEVIEAYVIFAHERNSKTLKF